MAKKTYTPRERLNRINAYNNAYNKKHYRSIGIQLNVETQSDVIAWFDEQDNKTQAVVNLVRAKLDQDK